MGQQDERPPRGNSAENKDRLGGTGLHGIVGHVDKVDELLRAARPAAVPVGGTDPLVGHLEVAHRPLQSWGIVLAVAIVALDHEAYESSPRFHVLRRAVQDLARLLADAPWSIRGQGQERFDTQFLEAQDLAVEGPPSVLSRTGFAPLPRHAQPHDAHPRVAEEVIIGRIVPWECQSESGLRFDREIRHPALDGGATGGSGRHIPVCQRQQGSDGQTVRRSLAHLLRSSTTDSR